MPILKNLLFFQISLILVPEIEICLKYFLDKKSQKQLLWYVPDCSYMYNLF